MVLGYGLSFFKVQNANIFRFYHLFTAIKNKNNITATPIPPTAILSSSVRSRPLHYKVGATATLLRESMLVLNSGLC